MGVDGGKVFEYKGRRSADQLQSWAVESHIKKGEPMSSIDSPLGPVGKLKGYMVRTGFFIFDFQKNVFVEYLGFSPLVAGGLFVLFVVFGSLFTIISISLLTMPRE